MKKALIIGASGQIGTELTLKLAEKLTPQNVIASDIRQTEVFSSQGIQFSILDALNADELRQVILENQVTEVYHLAATLSATAEKNPLFSWNLNMQSLLNVLELSREGLIEKVFWPSSIAVFGKSSPKKNTPQECVMSPSTVYGISKLAGEKWCKYYTEKYDVDVRSLRFPGLLGYKSDPGGGTTDYALWALKSAAHGESYTSFLSEHSQLPMMHMEDAINGIIKLMSADEDKIKVNTSYNIQGVSFSPEELFFEIKRHYPEFRMTYSPDFRQEIADSWPESLDDSAAKEDWGWNTTYSFSELIQNILIGFKKNKLIET